MGNGEAEAKAGAKFVCPSVDEDGVLRGFAYDFMGLLGGGLTRERVNRLLFAPAVEDFSI